VVRGGQAVRIVHFAPFAPHACGLYEAARDMVVADILAGNDSHLVDVGCTSGQQLVTEQGRTGLVDARGGSRITSAAPEMAQRADVLVCHTGVPDPWIATCQAPIVWVLHGRPAACFRPEQFGGSQSYSLMARVAAWPRVKACLSFWEEHEPFWAPIVPRHKLVFFPAPPVDTQRFSPDGPAVEFSQNGLNVLVADTWREDVDVYEIVHGVMAAAGRIRGLRLHLYGTEPTLGPWQFLIDHLKKLGVLGSVAGRVTTIDQAYRGADVLLSPHRIAVRTIAEALCCGLPVIAADGCRFTEWTCDPSDPLDVARALERFDRARVDRATVRRKAEADFGLAGFGRAISELYEGVQRV